MTDPAPYGFAVLGDPYGTRAPVDHPRLAAAYAAAAPAVAVSTPAYLSAWTYTADLLAHREAHVARRAAEGARDPEAGWTAGYRGPTAAPWLHWDLDRADPAVALEDVRRLVAVLSERYGPDGIVVYFSGSKGTHVDLNTGGLVPPSADVPRVARRLAETIAAEAGIALDPAIYSPVALYRASNSRHAKTGLHKTPIPLADLAAGIDVVEVKRRAARPIPHELPTAGPGPRFLADWSRAEAEHAAALARPATPNEAGSRLNLATWRVLTDPTSIGVGDRHRLLYSAVRDARERFDDVDDLLTALYTRPGSLMGLPPSEVARQIECALRDAGGGS